MHVKKLSRLLREAGVCFPRKQALLFFHSRDFPSSHSLRLCAACCQRNCSGGLAPSSGLAPFPPSLSLFTRNCDAISHGEGGGREALLSSAFLGLGNTQKECIDHVTVNALDLCSLTSWLEQRGLQELWEIRAQPANLSWFSKTESVPKARNLHQMPFWSAQYFWDLLLT